MIQGSIASLVTPFSESGHLDFQALHAHSRRMVEAGFDCLCASGGTGEFLSLTEQERKDALKVVIESSEGRPVVASALFATPAQILGYAEHAATVGAKAIMVMPPYFYVQSQQAIVDHLLHVAERSALPVLLFNSGGRSGRVMTPDTVLRLAHGSDKFIGIKETTEQIDEIAKLVREAPAQFKVIQAHEPLVLPSYAVGAVGSFGSLCNFIPKTIVRLHAALDAGDLKLARTLSDNITRIAEVAYAVTIPVGIKYLMNTLGILETSVRLPLSMSIDPAARHKLDQIVPVIAQLEGERMAQPA